MVITQNLSSPLLVMVMMVKNESASIEATLKNFFEEGLRHFVIYDTGSTDNTVDLCRVFFDQHDCIGHIKEDTFIDFASSRNHALDFAEDCFPSTHFFIMSDAEWYLHHGALLLNFCEQEKSTETPLYLINILMNETHFTTARLFRASSHVRFTGVVHEVPAIIATVKCPENVIFEVRATEHGIEKSRRRWQRDLLLLSKIFHENPDDSRNAFYLAQTYECLGLLENAFHIYQHRESLPGWDEENFITCFRLGYLAEILSQSNNQFSWDMAMGYYLKAFSLRPHRIEPLIKMADHFWPNNIAACYLFIKHAYDVPYPQQDTLFIEKQMYLYDRYEIMSRCAWHMGQFELGEIATKRALDARPNVPHLEQNLALYQNKIALKKDENQQRLIALGVEV